MLKEYEDLIEDYRDLQDNDPLTAYTIMKDASAILGTLETKLKKSSAELGRYKTLAEAMENEIAVEAMSNGDSATKAEKVAKAHEDRIHAWNDYHDANKSIGELDALVSYMWRIYYDCKAVWEHGNKVYRMGRDSK